MYSFLIMGDAERLVQAKFTDTVFFIELGQCDFISSAVPSAQNFSASSQILAQIRLL